MRRHGIAIVLLLSLVTSSVAWAGTDPRAERVRLTAADTALAKRTILRRTDLAAGWRAVPSSSDDSSRMSCPGYDPDFSAFTITGKATSTFGHPAGGSIVSGIEVYASRADAVGDFRVGAQPGATKCMRTTFEQALASTAGSGVNVTITSSRTVPAPHVGERSMAVRIVGDVSAGGQHVPLYMDVIAFQRGRSIATLAYAGANRRIAGQATLARVVDARMR
jgi:hypothetical protein